MLHRNVKLLFALPKQGIESFNEGTFHRAAMSAAVMGQTWNIQQRPAVFDT
jgi:hypothetical protein